MQGVCSTTHNDCDGFNANYVQLDPDENKCQVSKQQLKIGAYVLYYILYLCIF